MMGRRLAVTGLVIGSIAIAALIAYAALMQSRTFYYGEKSWAESAGWTFTTAGNYTVYKGDGTVDTDRVGLGVKGFGCG